MKGQMDDAEREFQAAQEISPKSIGNVAMGMVLLEAGRVAEAIALMRQQTARNPNDPWVLWLLAEALYRSGTVPGDKLESEAVEALERSIKLDSRLAQPRALLGKILLHRGEVDRAVEQLSSAVELDPKEVTTVYLLAQAYQKKGDHARAKELFARVNNAKQSELERTQRNLMRIIKPASQ